jgi:hypothetical protein
MSSGELEPEIQAVGRGALPLESEDSPEAGHEAGYGRSKTGASQAAYGRVVAVPVLRFLIWV